MLLMIIQVGRELRKWGNLSAKRLLALHPLPIEPQGLFGLHMAHHPPGLRGARLPNAAHVDRHLPLIPNPPVNGFLASANA